MVDPTGGSVQVEAFVEVPRRFNGPANLGNGGYVAGLLAQFVPGVATVRLRRPTPLDRPLPLRRDGDRVQLFDGDTLIADAGPGTLAIDVLPPPTREETTAAQDRAGIPEQHGAPTCFGCGTDRDADEALHISVGPLEDGRAAASLTRIPDDLGDDRGLVPAPVLWAALDCPGGWALGRLGIMGADRFPALIRQTAEVRREVSPGDELIAMGWPLDSDADRPEAGTALYTPDGDLVAAAHLVHAAMPADWARAG